MKTLLIRNYCLLFPLKLSQMIEKNGSRNEWNRYEFTIHSKPCSLGHSLSTELPLFVGNWVVMIIILLKKYIRKSIYPELNRSVRIFS